MIYSVEIGIFGIIQCQWTLGNIGIRRIRLDFNDIATTKCRVHFSRAIKSLGIIGENYVFSP